jgi:hypothetical protein
MVVDPRLYEKVTGRSADPSRRLGEVLAKGVKKQHERDELPKGIAGGLRVTRMPGTLAQWLLFWKLWRRDKD